MVLLMGFSFSAGPFLSWSGAAVANWDTWLVFLGMMGAALIGSKITGTLLPKIPGLLNILATAYLLYWLAIILWDPPKWILMVWILTGLVLFTLLSAAALQRGTYLAIEENSTPLAIELWLLLLNLFWLSSLI